jgi:hypothetical protein
LIAANERKGAGAQAMKGNFMRHVFSRLALLGLGASASGFPWLAGMAWTGSDVLNAPSAGSAGALGHSDRVQARWFTSADFVKATPDVGGSYRGPTPGLRRMLRAANESAKRED